MNDKSLRRKFSRFQYGYTPGSRPGYPDIVMIRQAHSLDGEYRGIESSDDSPLLDMAWVERVGTFDWHTTGLLTHLLLTGEKKSIESVQGSLKRGLAGLVLRVNGRIVGDITLPRRKAHQFVRYLKLLIKESE